MVRPYLTKLIIVLLLLVSILFAYPNISNADNSPTSTPPPPPPPTFSVTSISIDKTSLTGTGSIKLDYTIETTNFTGPSLGKIGIPRLQQISGEDVDVDEDGMKLSPIFGVHSSNST